MILDYKNHFGQVKDVDMKGRRVSGYLSAFDNKDSDGDVIVKGAYAKSLNERKGEIFFLNQHNWSQPHGKFDELKEDSTGLYFVSNPLIDTTYSTDTLNLYEAGIIKEHSVGFITVKDEIKSDARYIKEIKLYEGSNVTLGANSQTPFTGFKSSLKEIDDQSKRILKALRDGTFTDDTFILLEVALKQLQQEAFELGKKSLTEPPVGTQPEPINKETEILKEYLKKWN
jgi:HK97 family phage prohead protease